MVFRALREKNRKRGWEGRCGSLLNGVGGEDFTKDNI